MACAIVQETDAQWAAHVAQARRVLELPVEVTGLHWHPFGVYAIPLARRTAADGSIWSQRLHLWHPQGRPVGESSPYGVHTHSGLARSHVLTGALQHHLYAFDADDDGTWQRACLGTPEGQARLLWHVQGETRAGATHTLPADRPHSVSKGDGWAISLFEQMGGPQGRPFTTWQRTDRTPEALVRRGPAPVEEVRRDALHLLDQIVA